MLLSLFILGSCLGTAQAAVENLSAAQVRELLSRDKKIFLLDVRTPGEYFQIRLAGARLIPIDQLERRVAEIPRNQPVLVYCAVGSRSMAVADYLSRIGVGEVYNLYGGIWAWQLRGYPVLAGPGG